jgi:GntR family transcriptional regulator of vanillate catabolism
MAEQGRRALVRLRQMIMAGELKPGTRVAEVPVAARLGVSRMPVRLALPILEQEGLLQKTGRRGYRVRPIGEKEIRDAIEVRGALEGVAARLVAEAGLDGEMRAVLIECLERGDAIFKKGSITEIDVEAFHDLNVTFHDAILEACGNAALSNAIARNDHLPFASIRSLAVDLSALDVEFRRLDLAHLQHHLIFDALDKGQSARAEAVMREHAYAAVQYLELFTGLKIGLDRVTFIAAAE